jgi:PrtD family type I secretion system ABC transporter
MTAQDPSEHPGSNADAPSLLDGAIRACRRALLTIGAFSFVINLLMLTVPMYMIQVFNRVMTSRSEDTLLVLTMAALTAFAVMAVLDLVRSRMLVRIGVWLEARLGGAVFIAALRPTSRYGGNSTQAVRDLAHVRGYLTGSGVLPLLDAPWVPVFVALVFVIHPALGVVALLGAVTLFTVAYVNELATRRPLAEANQAHAETMAAVETMSRQGDSVEALGMGPALTKWWAVRSSRTTAGQTLASDRAGSLSAVGRFLRLALQIGILGLAAMFVVRQELSAGAMMAASIMLARALAPVEQAIGSWRQLINARTAFQRLKEVLNRAEAEPARMRLPRPKGVLTVEAASYAPQGAEEPLFHALSVTVGPGEMLGIFGPSGAGKTTLARMLVGLAAPGRGRIRLDGMDVDAWPSDDLGRHVGYVPQSAELLPGTVRDNIVRFTGASPRRAIEAAKRAGIHELVLRLPAGYDTVVGGSNDLLSAGTRQRVALARALFRDPQLLVLDEPYSNLDAQGTEALMLALRQAKARGATIVIVAHRASILGQADKVLHIEGGACRVIDKAALARLTVVTPTAGNPARPAEQPAERPAVEPTPQPSLPAKRVRKRASGRLAEKTA